MGHSSFELAIHPHNPDAGEVALSGVLSAGKTKLETTLVVEAPSAEHFAVVAADPNLTNRLGYAICGRILACEQPEGGLCPALADSALAHEAERIATEKPLSPTAGNNYQGWATNMES